MNYSNEEIINALAAEYVLGTLRGKARDRFTLLKASRQDFQQAVWYWESQLNDIGLEIKPRPPRSEVWQAIYNKLRLSSYRFGDPATIVEPKYKSAPKAGFSPWKWAVGVLTASSFVLALLLATYVGRLDRADQAVAAVAIFSDENSHILWSIDFKSDLLHVKSTELLQLQANNDYHLWIIPKSGNAPISIGLLPQTGERTIKARLAIDYNAIEAMAVSIEPLGGSPTGQPSKVLFSTNLVAVGN